MAYWQIQPDFAALFKKFRLKSEIETLAEFGDLMAEEGYIYENSLFTRWQNGERRPKDRKLLIGIVALFAKRGGISDVAEANDFLKSANQRDLSDDEVFELNRYFSKKERILPDQIEIFVGREEIIKDIVWQLINKKKSCYTAHQELGRLQSESGSPICLKISFPMEFYGSVQI